MLNPHPANNPFLYIQAHGPESNAFRSVRFYSFLDAVKNLLLFFRYAAKIHAVLFKLCTQRTIRKRPRRAVL